MKKMLLAAAFAAFSLSAWSQDSTALAKVNKRKGVEIYVMSEPLRPYEVTGQVTADDFTSVLNALNGKQDQRTITQMIDVLINNATRKQKKKKLEYDAIITEDGETGTLIKFN